MCYLFCISWEGGHCCILMVMERNHSRESMTAAAGTASCYVGARNSVLKYANMMQAAQERGIQALSYQRGTTFSAIPHCPCSPKALSRAE